MATDPRVSDLLQQHAAMRNERQPHEQAWQEIAERIIPRKALFKRGPGETGQGDKGKKRTEKIFDASPGIALDRGAAALHSLVVPRNQQWHGLKPIDAALKDDPAIVSYLEEVTRRLFAARYSSNYDNQVHESFYDAMGFGTMTLFVGDRVGQAIYYRSVPVHQLFIAENEFGTVDRVHREFPMTARQAYARWGDKCADAIANAVKGNNPLQEFAFVHAVYPNNERDAYRADWRGMAYKSCIIDVTNNRLMEEGGFRTFPYPCARYTVTSGEVYGRGPAATVLPDIKMLNEIERTGLQARQLAVLPPLLAARDGVLDAVKLTPAAINYGAINDQGHQMVVPLKLGDRIDLAEEKADQKRRVINDAFWNTLFQILVDNPQMTATEAMLRAQEKGALLAPTASRIETEFLSVQIQRELDILAMAGQLPEMPQKLVDAGGMYEVEFSSPLTRARQAEEGVAILRSVEQLAPLAQALGPERGAAVFRSVNVDEAVKLVFQVNGVPQKVLLDDDALEEVKAQGQQAAQLGQVLQAAPVAADAAKNLAQAAALTGGMPGAPSILSQPAA